VSDNPYLLLLLSAEAQLSRGEQTVDDQYIFVGAIVDEFGLALLADDEQRRQFALPDPGRELDIDLAAIIVGTDRTPRRAVALEGKKPSPRRPVRRAAASEWPPTIIGTDFATGFGLQLT
jgi:hypothetical protein